MELKSTQKRGEKIMAKHMVTENEVKKALAIEDLETFLRIKSWSSFLQFPIWIKKLQLK